MSEQQKVEDRKLNLRGIPSTLWAIVVVVIVIATYFLAQQNKSVQVALDKEGKLAFEVRGDMEFSQVFENAMSKDRTIVDAILASQNYYNLSDVKLVDRIANLDPSVEVSKKLRNLLWDLRGPFRVPGTLRGADENMIKALDDLETALENAKEANALLTHLWEQTLDRTGIFRPRRFNATVEIVSDDLPDKGMYRVALACPGGALVSGRVMFLYTQIGGALIEVTQIPSVFDCDGLASTVKDLFAGRTIRLGVSQAVFKELFDPAGTSDDVNGQMSAKFELFPKSLVDSFAFGKGGVT